jgi:hypothetical protein
MRAEALKSSASAYLRWLFFMMANNVANQHTSNRSGAFGEPVEGFHPLYTDY